MVEDILLWRQSLSTLPDHHFFDIIRMYLGEVKTPYNKQKLIEDLSAFLRREENKRMIAGLLSPEDLEIVTAVKELPCATQEKLLVLFAGSSSYADLYEQLMNLEERLVLYRHQDRNTGRIVFDLNPMLESVLLPLVWRDRLFPPAEIVEPAGKTGKLGNTASRKLTPELLAAVYSFLLDNPEIFKADGTFKKKYEALLPEIFPVHCGDGFLNVLIEALQNLNLIRIVDSGISVRTEKWRQFAELDEASQYAYLAAAASGRFPRGVMQHQAQLVLNLMAEIPEEGYTRDILIRKLYLLKEKKEPVSGSSHSGRFAAILRQAAAGESGIDEPQEIAGSDERLIHAAELFGFIYEAGKDACGKAVYKSASPMEERTGASASLDGGFNLTVLPGFPLKKLLPVSLISVPVRYEAILQLEICRNAVMRCFDGGMKPEDIGKNLGQVLSHEVPQSLLFSINDWYEGYSAASLYRGYVLKILPQKEFLVERNPEFASHIQQKLAPGVYMLDFVTREEAVTVIGKSGLDFIGAIKDTRKEEEGLPLPSVYFAPAPVRHVVQEAGILMQEAEKQELFERLLRSVDEKNLSEEQADELRSRIKRRIVISESQLRPDSVRPEKNEASGMDFLGKIHIIERAVASESLLNIQYEGETYLVQPVRVEKQNGDALLKGILQPAGTDFNFQIGRVQYIKRIRGPVFKERGYS